MKKLLMYSLGIAGLATAGLAAAPSLAQAQSANSTARGNGGGYGYQQVMQTKAQLLGMTEDELRTQLQTKTMLQIAADKGISEDKLHATMQQAAQERWQAHGLTPAEIATRLQTMQERQSSDHDGDSAYRGGGMQHNRYNQ